MARSTQYEERPTTRVKAFSAGFLPALLAAGALALGAASLLGWLTGDASLLEPFANFDHMQPIGALCLFGGALGLLLLELGWGRLGTALALGTAAVAAIELVAGLIGRETGFQQLLAPWLATD